MANQRETPSGVALTLAAGRVTLLLALLITATLDAWAAENTYFYCVPKSYEPWRSPRVDCNAADADKRLCKEFRVDLDELVTASGSYSLHTRNNPGETYLKRDFTLSRATGEYSLEIEGSLYAYTNFGKCELRKEAVKF